MKTPGGRIEFANSLRGFAALSVLISHYFGVFWYARENAGKMANAVVPTIDQVPTPFYAEWVVTFPIALAPFGVALFFLISGFVIPFSIIKSSTSGFLVGRFLRIYPLYIAGFSVTLMALIISGKISGFVFPYTVDDVLFHFLPGIHVLAGTTAIDGIIWTLEIEIAFYIVCAITSPLIRSGNIFFFSLPALLLLFVYLFHDYPWSSNLKILAHMSEYMIFMMIGVAFNYLFRGLLSPRNFLIITSITAFLFFCGMSINNEPNSVAMNYAAALIIFTLSAITSRHWKKSAILGFLADISYPLYVVHGVMGYAIMAHLISLGVSPFACIITATITSMIVAWILHISIEIPSHNLGKRLTSLMPLKRTVGA